MEHNELHEKWPELKTKIKEAYPELADEDLLLEIGKENELLLKLQEKLQKNRKEIFDFLKIMG